MELNILEKKKNRLVFELKGADHTLCSALRDELWNDKDVKAATYAIEHPLTATPRFIVETGTQDPIKAIQDASKRLQKANKDLQASLAKL